MQTVKDIFSPLIGQFTWSVRRGHGSFLTMEFGKPYLSVREPITATSAKSLRVRQNLARRRVIVVGQWHLWILDGEWKISTTHHTVNYMDSDLAKIDEALAELDGQILTSVDPGNVPHSCAFKFDLGGALDVAPSKRASEDQWRLHNQDGNIVAYRNDGRLTFETAQTASSSPTP